jgi:hypothetical protein
MIKQMAILETPQASGGMFKAIKDAIGLFGDTNKAGGVTENTNPTPEDEYESSLDPQEVLELTSKWKRTYSVYYDAIEKGQKLSFDYWVGKHRQTDGALNAAAGAATGTDNNGVTDNLIFEAIETFLPIATRANPDPLVQADPGEVGQQLAHDIKVALVQWADKQLLRRKLAKGARSWLLNRLGVFKLAWNPLTKTIELSVPNTKRMVFDADGFINEHCEFTGEYIGEKKKVTAGRLIEMFPKKKAEILKKSGGKTGTKLEYFEWWYKTNGAWTDTFYTLEDDVLLGKFKNPNWNYDIEPIEPSEADMDSETGLEINEAKEAQVGQPGVNHLKTMPAPYRFLAIFSTGEQPHDNTSLILQNIPQQDKINRREQQIEYNVKAMNNGIVVDGMRFTEEQASQAAAALRRGMAIRVPSGGVQNAVLFPERPALPGDVFNSLKDARGELRNIFGTAGSTAQGVESQDTVRGKIMVNQMDSSRIGGGITEYIEQVADAIYNLVVQYMFVYYDEEHFITAAGSTNGMELVVLKNDKFPQLKTLDITVKEGSLIPKDPLTQRNEAIDLWSAGAIDPRNLFKKLDFPDPDEATNQLILWQMFQKGQITPEAYLPSFAVAGQPAGQQPVPPGVGGPAVNDINGPDVGQVPAPLTSPGAEQQESQQLIKSVPLPKV